MGSGNDLRKLIRIQAMNEIFDLEPYMRHSLTLLLSAKPLSPYWLLSIWCVPAGQYNQQTVLLLAMSSKKVRSYWSIPKECTHFREFGFCEALLVFVVLNQETSLLLAMSNNHGAFLLVNT